MVAYLNSGGFQYHIRMVAIEFADHDEEREALFSGDAIPAAGEYPIYEDVLGTVRFIKKLRDIKGLRVLLSSWADPQYGDTVYEAMEAA